ncbi:MAG: hypothetical protein SFU53_12505 [Terrimicrobiaceae bacterium]|nr:hypothetical protein [Terrimicrobiaceae bacterium]
MSLGAVTDWKRDAARIVEELFRVTSPENWDLLLDLRQALLAGEDWARALDLFLHCRVRLESDHYLPFYRLRRLIAASLRLEATSAGLQPSSLGELLKDRHRSLADLKRRVRREWFEHSEEPGGHVSLRVVEA